MYGVLKHLCSQHTYWYLQIIHTCTTLCFRTIIYLPNSSTKVLSLEDNPPNTITTTREELMAMAVMVWSSLLIMLSSSTVTCGNVFIVFTDTMSIMMSVINLSNKYCWWYNFAKLLSLQQYKHMSMLREVLQHWVLLQWRCFRRSCCVWRNNGTVERVLTYATEPHNRYTAVMSKAETITTIILLGTWHRKLQFQANI